MKITTTYSILSGKIRKLTLMKKGGTKCELNYNIRLVIFQVNLRKFKYCKDKY